MDTLEVPFSVIAAAISGTASIVGAWMLVKGRLASLERDCAAIAESLAEHGRSIRILDQDSIRFAERLKHVEERAQSSLAASLFDERMHSQDDQLEWIRQALQGKANKSSLSSMTRVDPRSDEVTTPMPPMRPRLPSRRGPGAE